MNHALDFVRHRHPEFDPAALRNAATLLELALAEDLGIPFPLLSPDGAPGLTLEPTSAPITTHPGDITSAATIPENARGSAVFVARRPGVVAGIPVVQMAAHRLGLANWLELQVSDGARIERGTTIATIAGPMRQLLLLERTALNFLQRLSGVATLTARFVEAVRGTSARVLDTRKTTPGWRALEKYAVRQGGGTNHRFGLYDQVLIKDNHLAWLAHLGHADPIGTAVAQARKHAPKGTLVEIEVDSLDQFDRALQVHPDIILVDNLGPEALAESIRRRDARAPGILLEASGGITLETIGALARTGVDRISVGALTHSAPALDIALDYDRTPSS